MTKVSVVICYHQSDEPHLRLLEAHLAPICRENLLEIWHRGQLRPGDECDAVVAQKLQVADLILLLVSADFNVAYDAALLDTLRGSAASTPRLVPIPLRPCVWTGHPFFGLQPVPADGTPLIVNGTPDEARFCTASTQIRELVVEMLADAAAEEMVNPDECTIPTPPGMMEALAASQREIHGLEQSVRELERMLRTSIRAVQAEVSYRPAVITSLINVERQQQHRIGYDPMRSANDPQIAGIERLRSALATAAELDLDSCTTSQLINFASEFVERLFHPTQSFHDARQTTRHDDMPTELEVATDDTDARSHYSDSQDRPDHGAPLLSAHARDDLLGEDRLRQLYNDYLCSRRSVGQSTAGLTFEALAGKLRSHARGIKAAYPTKTIDYQVVLKDGAFVLRPILRETIAPRPAAQDTSNAVGTRNAEPETPLLNLKVPS